jgi:hypothetical protein
MPQTSIRVASELLEALESHRPKWKTLPRFVEDQLEKVLFDLDSEVTLNWPSRQAPGPTKGGGLLNKEEKERARETPVSPKVHPADPFRLKAISAHMVPDDLAASADLFCEWWSVRGKGAVRSSKVAEREFNKLRAFKPTDRAAALQKAIAGGWKQLYKPDELKSRNTPQEPISNHPAHKVFKADDLGPEWDIPSATGGKGVLEGMF